MRVPHEGCKPFARRIMKIILLCFLCVLWALFSYQQKCKLNGLNANLK